MTKNEFVVSEIVWLLEGCLADLRDAAADPMNAKYESVLAICETTSALVKRFDALNIVQEEPEAARSASEIPMTTIILLGRVLGGEAEQCQSCGGWRHPN